MAKIIRYRPVKERDGMKMGGSEVVVFIMMGVGLVLGARYYFQVYRKSPAYALGQFFSAVKAGDVNAQYALLDEADKRSFPDEKSYDKTPLAHGYAERIQSVNFSNEKTNASANTATVDAALTVRGSSQGKELYQQSNQSIQDSYTLHKDGNGDWKVVLSESKLELPNKAEPSPRTESFTNN